MLDPDALTGWLREIYHPVCMVSFGVFLLLGGWVAVAPPLRRRGAINLLLVYLAAVNLAVASTGIDDWPFSPYAMMSTDARGPDRRSSMIVFRAVDSTGTEWPVDTQAWAPLFPQSMMGWYEVASPTAPAMVRREVAQFQLARAERARRERFENRWIGNRRWLGPLAAPDTNLYGREPAPAPRPFVALRVYRYHWNMRELYETPTAFRRELVQEFRP